MGMPADGTNKPAGISIAAIVLALMAAVGLLAAGLLVAVLFLKHYPVVPNIPTVHLFVVCFDLLIFLLVLWSIWTVVGLFQLKPWARFSILALGALDLCFFGVQSVGLLMLRSRSDFSLTMPTGPGAIHVSTVLLEIAAFDAVLALIGVWWLVYFSLSHVRLAFVGEHTS
jgi:hypothetical protein